MVDHELINDLHKSRSDFEADMISRTKTKTKNKLTVQYL